MHSRLVVLIVALAPRVNIVIPVYIILELGYCRSSAVLRNAYRTFLFCFMIKVKPLAEFVRGTCLLIPSKISVVSDDIGGQL